MNESQSAMNWNINECLQIVIIFIKTKKKKKKKNYDPVSRNKKISY